MSIEKAKLKVLVADEISNGLQEALARAENGAVEARGGIRALASVKDELKTATQEVATEWKEGKIQLNGEDPSAVPKYVVDVHMRVMRRIHDRAENAAQAALVADGKVVGIRAAIEQVSAMRAREEAKASKTEDSVNPLYNSGDNGGPRSPGEHPGLTLKARRNAEEADGTHTADSDAPKLKKKVGRRSKKATRATNS